MTNGGIISYRLPAMRRLRWLRIVTVAIVCTAFLILLYPYLSVYLPEPKDRIAWRRNLEAGLAEAKKSGKPVFLDFSASWCPGCQEMERTTWPDSKVEQVLTSNYIPVQIDGDQPGAQAISERYGVNELPALFILDSDGKIIRAASLMSTEEVLKFLDKKAPAS